MSPKIEDKILTLASKVSADSELEIVEIKCSKSGNKMLLRLYIHKSGGVSVKDCSDFSRTLEVLIEAEGIINSSYVLEVSSPGLDRPLKTRKDFLRNKGNLIKVEYECVPNKVTSFVGVLSEVCDSNICLSSDNETRNVDLDTVLKAKQEVCF